METRAVPGPRKALGHIKIAAIFISVAFLVGIHDGLSAKMAPQLTMCPRTHTLVLIPLMLNLGQPTATNRMRPT